MASTQRIRILRSWWGARTVSRCTLHTACQCHRRKLRLFRATKRSFANCRRTRSCLPNGPGTSTCRSTTKIHIPCRSVSHLSLTLLTTFSSDCGLCDRVNSRPLRFLFTGSINAEFHTGHQPSIFYIRVMICNMY